VVDGTTPCIHLIVNSNFSHLSSRNRHHAVEHFWELWRSCYKGKDDAFEVVNHNGHRVAGTNGAGSPYLEANFGG
nr:hypothetical protein [Armatimonadota bacterium]